MNTKDKLRQRLISRIKHLSEDKLNSVEGYLNQLETEIMNKADILSFAGIFKNLDQEAMDELTVNLPERRLKGISRIQ